MNFDKDRFIREFGEWVLRSKKVTFKGHIGLRELLTFIEADDQWQDERQLSYFLSTAFHETAATFKAVKEYRAKEGTVARRVQDKYWFTGFFGRGICQLTHKYNYEKLGKRLNIPLVENPELALEPTYSYEIAVVGMREGLFTGHKLDDYINKNKCDYYGARKIINGTDRATLLQSYAISIEKIIKNCLVDDFEQPVVNEEKEVLGNTLPQTSQNILPVAGGASDDPAVSIESVETDKPSGLKTWWTSVTTFVGSLGIGGSTIISALGGVFNEKYVPILLNLGIIFLVFAGLVVLTYLIIRQISAARKEKLAAQITIEQMRIKANPHLINVEVVKKAK